MSQQRFADMSAEAFDALIDGHIERTAAGADAMPADMFFDVLVERLATEVTATVTLDVDVAGDQLVLTPDRDSGDIVVQGNAILIGGRRIVLQLARKDEG
jgi:hypothetical protein